MPEPTVFFAEPPAGYTIRRLEHDDAPGVVACVRQIYGDSYVHPELYDAEAIVRLNASGELLSVVTLDSRGQVVGHYALERPDLGDLAETGEALVLPEHRHHQLMEAMRTLLEAEARKLSLRGLFGNVVTNHVFSQRVVERFGELPCAVSFGWSPRSFHNLAQSLTQRMSEIVFFKFLQSTSSTVAYLPPRQAAICQRIYAQFGVSVESPADHEVSQSGEIDVGYRPTLQRAMLRVRTVGTDSAAQIRLHKQSLLAAGAEAIFLELPLAQPGTPDLCEQAEAGGFFFSGIGPGFAADGDVLRLQHTATDLDVSQIQVEHPFAKELVGYVADERERANATADQTAIVAR